MAMVAEAGVPEIGSISDFGIYLASYCMFGDMGSDMWVLQSSWHYSSCVPSNMEYVKQKEIQSGTLL